MCLFAHAPYYKLNKGFFLGFLFKPLGGLPPHGLNKKSLGKVSFIYYILDELTQEIMYITGKIDVLKLEFVHFMGTVI